ncbi:hypothetical protein [Tardiphaga sp.]|jgi:hypothetical protein|uniref:hypothetical protein n=1 Tax=Tardiphaga sp. TaxID=1926292 RepID=UPI0037DA2F52
MSSPNSIPAPKRPAVSFEQKPQKWHKHIVENAAKNDGNFYWVLGQSSWIHFLSEEWAQKLAAREPFELLPLAPETAPQNQLPTEDGQMWYFRQGQFHKL